MFKLPARCQMQSSNYEPWSKTLKGGSVVAIQQFWAPKQSAVNLDHQVEAWGYERAELEQRGKNAWVAKTVGHKARFTKDGRGINWGADPTAAAIDEWGEVFPMRIIPVVDSLSTLFDESAGAWVFLDAPVFEPLFTGQQRHHYFLPLTELRLAARRRTKIAPNVRHYTHDVIDGRKLVAFAPEPLKQSDQLGIGWRYLYSEQL